MKRTQFLNVIVIAITIIMACGLTSCTRCKNAWSALCNSEQTVDTKTLTTLDVVAQRKAEIEARRIDSVYYNIQEPAFIAILDYVGTSATRTDIVKQYEKSIKFYEGINYGTKLHNHYAPDSIPSAPVPINDTPAIPQTKQ